MPEDTEVSIYAQQLQRVNQLNNKVVIPKLSPVQMITQTEQTMTLKSNCVTPSQQLSATEKQIIDPVARMMQNRTKLLIQELEDQFDVISWNDNAQLVLDGSTIPNSNIVNLVNDICEREKVLIKNTHLPKHLQK